MDFLAIHADDALWDVDLHVAKTHDRIGYGWTGPAQGRSNSGKKFCHAKWLFDVVVRSEIESLDLVLLLSAGRQDDNGELADLPDRADHLRSVEVRETEIEQDQVRVSRRGFGDAGRGSQAFMILIAL